MARRIVLLALAAALLTTLTAAHPPTADGDAPCFTPATGAELPWPPKEDDHG